MPPGVDEWVQEGRLYVWRYKQARRNWRGWQFTADPAGCRSVRNLLDRMRGGAPCHRTLNLETVTNEILSVPNYGGAIAGGFGRLRVVYRPEFDDLQIEPDGEKLVMTIGERRIGKLSAAFAEVEVGMGDFGIDASDDRKMPSWMFWWMPVTKYR